MRYCTVSTAGASEGAGAGTVSPWRMVGASGCMAVGRRKWSVWSVNMGTPASSTAAQGPEPASSSAGRGGRMSRELYVAAAPGEATGETAYWSILSWHVGTLGRSEREAAMAGVGRSRRSKSESEAPERRIASVGTTGGSWHWSPTMTKRE
jgi:hypothetical protein